MLGLGDGGGVVFPMGIRRCPFSRISSKYPVIPGPRGSALHDPEDLKPPVTLKSTYKKITCSIYSHIKVRRYFDRADNNKDGKLTKEEWFRVLNSSGVPTSM